MSQPPALRPGAVETGTKFWAEVGDTETTACSQEESTTPGLDVGMSSALVTQVGESATPVTHEGESASAVTQVGESVTPTTHVGESVSPVTQVEESGTPATQVEDPASAVTQVEESATPLPQVDLTGTPFPQMQEPERPAQPMGAPATLQVQTEGALTPGTCMHEAPNPISQDPGSGNPFSQDQDSGKPISENKELRNPFSWRLEPLTPHDLPRLYPSNPRGSYTPPHITPPCDPSPRDDYFVLRPGCIEEAIKDIGRKLAEEELRFQNSWLLTERAGTGLRIQWDKLREPSFLDRWNPWSRQMPFIALTEHPAASKNGTVHPLCQLYSFRVYLTEAVRRAHQTQSLPGRANGVLLLEQPIRIDTYLGLVSSLTNWSQLGYAKPRGTFGF
ncbi:uncharacterized protein [Scyliorhinus torazame]|uniref:uncharacterized protein isoform X2 n=1 Tax=Scyliorhinus torazame TaxID=75743 RepID=UPI003B5BE46F